MTKEYDFFIAGRTRNKDNILKVCDIFDKYSITYYCFLKNEETMHKAKIDLFLLRTFFNVIISSLENS